MRALPSFLFAAMTLTCCIPETPQNRTIANLALVDELDGRRISEACLEFDAEGCSGLARTDPWGWRVCAPQDSLCEACGNDTFSCCWGFAIQVPSGSVCSSGATVVITAKAVGYSPKNIKVVSNEGVPKGQVLEITMSRDALYSPKPECRSPAAESNVAPYGQCPAKLRPNVVPDAGLLDGGEEPDAGG
jgi:hypothetical protein